MVHNFVTYMDEVPFNLVIDQKKNISFYKIIRFSASKRKKYQSNHPTKLSTTANKTNPKKKTQAESKILPQLAHKSRLAKAHSRMPDKI